MKIPFMDLAAQHAHLMDDILADMRTLLTNCAFMLGPEVDKFEQAFAKMSGAEYCIGVNSGTDAMVLALRAMGVGPGDEVIIPAFTFIATADAVIRVGAKPVFVDVHADTMNIDVEKIPEALTAETRAIIPVHLFGRACEMDLLASVANELGLLLLEDAAQACGTILKDRWCGTMSVAGALSFYPTKNLGAAGDGGCVLCNDGELAAEIRAMRDHGRAQDGSFPVIGYNSRLSAIQAVYLNNRLDEFEDSLLDRIENARLYTQLLQDVNVTTPEFLEDRSHTYNYYTILTEERDGLQECLRQNGIGCAIYYRTPLPYEPCMRHLGCQPGDFPVAESLAECVLSLPIYPGLTKRQIEQVCSVVREYCGMKSPVS